MTLRNILLLHRPNDKVEQIWPGTKIAQHEQVYISEQQVPWQGQPKGLCSAGKQPASRRRWEEFKKR